MPDLTGSLGTGGASRPPSPARRDVVVRRWMIRYRELVAIGDDRAARRFERPLAPDRPIAPGGLEPPTSRL